MKILVIGGTGAAGSTVVTGLLKQGAMVRVMSHSPDKLKNFPLGWKGSGRTLMIPIRSRRRSTASTACSC